MASKEEVGQIFNQMENSFKPEKAEGVNATIQFDLSGENGGKYWVKINDGSVTHGEGDVGEPDMTLRSSADDFHALVNGNLNPMQAVMMGKIKISDVQLGMKMMNMFQLG